MSYPQIADIVGFESKQAAYWHVNKALRDIAKKISEDADEIRTLELERLDHMQRVLWANMLTRNGPTPTGVDVQVIDRLLKIQERRAKLLGLDEYDARLAGAAETVAAAMEIQTSQMQDAMLAILQRVGLTDEQWRIVPGIVVEELEAISAQGNPQGTEDETGTQT